MQPDMKTSPMLERVFVSGWMVGGVRTSQTPKMRPVRRVFHIRLEWGNG